MEVLQVYLYLSKLKYTDLLRDIQRQQQDILVLVSPNILISDN